MKWTALVAAYWTAALLAGPSGGAVTVSFEETASWATKLGSELYKICSKATGLHELRKDYADTYKAQVRKKDGGRMVEQFATDIQELFRKRLDAVLRLKRRAEELHKKHEYVTDHHKLSDIPFFNAKEVGIPKKATKASTTDADGEPVKELTFDLTPNLSFYGLEVNTTNSTVHVPTNVYSRAPEVIGNISWSGKLDECFHHNLVEGRATSWQYFASSVGFLRYFPGAKWRFGNDLGAASPIDLYDARMSPWYTQAASHPKNMVLLLDSSGSLKGRRLQVAKATLMKLLDTLNENDFFNVLVFSNETRFLDDCSNNTLMQATYHNKKRIETALDSVETGKIADFAAAFTMAFELLMEVNGTQQCAQCNNAIMLITDGSPQSHEEVFNKYNWAYDKWVRVFTYLIGQEIPENDAMKVSWMACANRGHFYHIYTMADVQEHVQDYVRVMSRPLAIKNEKYHIYSGISINVPYTSQDSSQGNAVPFSDTWVKLPDGHKPAASVTVATPVYDKSETKMSAKTGSMTDNGKLLGVAATDVPMEDIVALVPQHKLGTNGYFFIITNNGFIVSHPSFRPLVENCPNQRDASCYLWHMSNTAVKFGSTKPGYNNVDLLLLENEEGDGTRVDALRTLMIDQEIGSLTVNATGYFDNSMTRVRLQTQTYYYHPIRDTIYSIAIVLPKKFDDHEVYGSAVEPPYAYDFNTTLVHIANWTYCRFTPEELAFSSRLKLLLEILDQRKLPQGESLFEQKCDVELVKQLLFDARVTRGLLAIWLGNNNGTDVHRSVCSSTDQGCRDRPTAPASGGPATKKSDGGSSSSGAGSRGGSSVPSSSSTSSGVELVFAGTQSGLTRYLQLVDKPSGEDSAAEFIGRRTNTLKELYYMRAGNAENDTWVFSVPYDSHTRNESNIVLTASTGIFVKRGRGVGMAAALGLQMRYDKVKDLLMSLTFPCPGSSLKTCRQGCGDENLTCYLLDNNAYVVVSEYVTNVGRHFSDVDYQAMEEFQQADVFKTFTITDHQALCTVCDLSKSLASKLLNPVMYIYKLLYWMVTEIALFLVEFNLSAWLSEWNYANGEEATYDYPYYRHDGSNVEAFVRAAKTLTELNQIYPVSCTMDINMTESSLADVNVTGRIGQCSPCSDLPRSFAIHRVPKTNLFLLVLESGCTCEKSSYDPYQKCLEAHEVVQGCSIATVMSKRHRRLPGACANRNLKEDESKCGHAVRIVARPTRHTLLALAAMAALFASPRMQP